MNTCLLCAAVVSTLALNQLAVDGKEKEQRASVQDDELTWTDPDTRLMWQRKSNGSNVTWREAGSYCSSLRLAGHSDWRLPSMEELVSIYSENALVNSRHIKGRIHLNGGPWSSTLDDSGEVRVLDFTRGNRWTFRPDLRQGLRALCVRGSGG